MKVPNVHQFKIRQHVLHFHILHSPHEAHAVSHLHILGYCMNDEPWFLPLLSSKVFDGVICKLYVGCVEQTIL